MASNPEQIRLARIELAKRELARRRASVTPYEPSMLESAAEGISNMVPDAIPNAMARVPMPRPIESTQDFALPERTGNPLTDALRRVAYPASMAARSAQTVAGSPQVVGEGVAELGGQAGFPKTAAVAGMAVANAPMLIPMGQGANINTALKPFKGKPGIAARIKQARTGVEASAFEQLRRDPTAFFLTKSREEAGAAVGEAKTAAGISTGVTDDISTLTPEMFQRQGIFSLLRIKHKMMSSQRSNKAHRLSQTKSLWRWKASTNGLCESKDPRAGDLRHFSNGLP